ncbi:MAG: hypothetical protein HY544_00165 [Candidatus Diapherotrites archaeon]|uniref:Uncharacterized protein n=1 Tax=Candidatus Iainarchaeum sp. TaxID=3101447 RepID=A0A8T3YLY0_9ARCH|nr:hypothetical protein [Candidatus Diapherotrites archaeon]
MPRANRRRAYRARKTQMRNMNPLVQEYNDIHAGFRRLISEIRYSTTLGRDPIPEERIAAIVSDYRALADRATILSNVLPQFFANDPKSRTIENTVSRDLIHKIENVAFSWRTEAENYQFVHGNDVFYRTENINQ